MSTMQGWAQRDIVWVGGRAMTVILVLLLVEPFLTAGLAAAVTRSARVGALAGFTVAGVLWAYLILGIRSLVFDGRDVPGELVLFTLFTSVVVPVALLRGWVWAFRHVSRAWAGAGISVGGFLLMAATGAVIVAVG